MNGCSSKVSKVKYGVPQGSKLGPILFILYMNDIVNVMEKCEVRLFADDTLVYLVGKKEEVMCEIINDDLLKVSEWLEMNGLILNTSKTKCMWIGMKETSGKCDIVMNDEIIERVNVYKYLGIMIDDRLKFGKHAEFVSKKIARKIGVINRLRKKVSIKGKLLIYNSLVQPHITYCNTIFNFFTKKQLDTLQRLQNRGMRAVLNRNRYSKVSDMKNELGWLNVRECIELHSLCFIYRLDRGLLPIYFDKYKKKGVEVHDHYTRGAESVRVICKARKAADLKGIFYEGVRLYNSLPACIREQPSIDAFRREVKVHFRNRSI